MDIIQTNYLINFFNLNPTIMKTKNLLSILLVLSVSINIMVYLTSMAPQDDCPELRSYTSGNEVSTNDAQSYIDAYQENAPGGVYGGIISGDAIKNMFCDPNSNGIAYHLATDPSGTVAPVGAVFVIIEGAAVTLDNKGGVSSATRASARLYMNNNWCPPNCVAIGE
jgi:hypothetical protein